MTEIKIEVPQGMVIDTENSNLANGIIKFKPAKKQLPKTWEEFCNTYPITEEECFLDSDATIKGLKQYRPNGYKISNSDKLSGTIQTCDAVLALMQLIQLRDCYNDGWKPDWKNTKEKKYIAYINYNNITIGINTTANHILYFKTEELRNTFINNFRDLIEIAKPLI